MRSLALRLYGNPLALSLFSGLVFAVAYRAPGAWPLAFVALVPLLFAITRTQNLKDAFYAGTLAGVGIMGAAFWWLFDALPLSSGFGDISPLAGFIMVFTSWVLAVATTALPVGLFAVIAKRVGFEALHSIPALAVLWLFFEYVRMAVYNLLTFSPDTANPLFMSVGFLGYPLMDSESWRQVAAFGGIWSLSLVVVLVNLLLYAGLRRRVRRARFTALFALALFVITVSFLPISAWREGALSSTKGEEISVAALSLSLPIRMPNTDTHVLENEARALVARAAEDGAELIVLPEHVELFEPFSDYRLSDTLSDSSRAVVIDSGIAILPDGTRVARAHARSALGSAGMVQDKRIFTPQGEYLPTLFRLALMLGSAQEQLTQFDAFRSLANAPTEGTPALVGTHRVSVLFCLEAMQPGLGRSITQEQGSDMLAITSSHAWFSRAPATIAQDALRFARMQAVHAGVPVAVAGDFSSAYILDRYGRILASAGSDGVPGIARAIVVLP